ncbi:MAG TPA: class I SAM-dependent methyltransferase [Verrucomicrobiae bacterium]|jgi:ubiquinone/menaquinone biosynthesis C-methylase UbiE|nr:class I SAM-dependent methyltransferase [Verrucomicrobiae bacterium]
MRPDEEVIKRWRTSAPFWEKHRDTIRGMFAPITQALIEDAEIGTQNSVLDVATGPGEPALSVAAAVGTNGKVVGVDAIHGMIAAARTEAQRLGLKNAKFDVAFADDLSFAANTFDAVISRFGVMFFPSPVDGVREMLRVLKPGRKLAFAVWHFAERNPFHSALSRVMDRYVDSPPLEPDALDAFRFAPRGKLLEVLSHAGVAAPSERLLQFKIEAAAVSVEDFWNLRREMSEKLSEKFATLSEEQKLKVTQEMLSSLAEYSTANGMSFPAEVLIVSGSKASPA